MLDDDELPEAKSYERYWWDCPECGETNDAEDIQPTPSVPETCVGCGIKVAVS